VRLTPLVRVFALTMMAVLLVETAWMLVVPPFRGMDEHDHAYKAAAVADGDWGWAHTPSPQDWGAFVQVPSDLPEAAAPICESLPYTTDDNCHGRKIDDDTTEIASSASQYNPAFYGVVGTVARPFSGATSLYVMRLATALMCAALLGLAAVALRIWSRSPWPVLGLMLTATPMLTYSNSIVAPNGVELCAAAVVWSALLGLCRPLRDLPPQVRSRLVVLATVGAVPLVTVRMLGPLWLALILGTVALLLPREGWRPLLRSRTTWMCASVVLVFMVGAVGWDLVAKTNALTHAQNYSESPWPLLPQLEVLWLLQAVAAFPARDELAALPLYAIVAVSWWVLLAAALRHGRARFRVSLAVAVGVSLAVPAAMTVLTFASEGTVWQGRYGYPYSLGFCLLCGYALDRAGVAPRRTPLVVAGATLVWASTQVIGQLGVLLKQSRISPLADTSAWLQPPAWLVVVLTAAAAGLLLLAQLGPRPVRRTAGVEPPSDNAVRPAQVVGSEPAHAEPVRAKTEILRRHSADIA
jgi:predicted membrane protein DUF2142